MMETKTPVMTRTSERELALADAIQKAIIDFVKGKGYFDTEVRAALLIQIMSEIERHPNPQEARESVIATLQINAPGIPH